MTDQTAADPVRIRRVHQHEDARGTVFEPLPCGALADQRNVHVVLTAPGAVRGNHVHREATETLVVRGPARVRYRYGAVLRDVDIAAGEVLAFTFPPGVAHAVRAEGSEPNVLVAFRDTPHDRAEPDSAPVELLEARHADGPGRLPDPPG
jgi:mannose-6-phosphate isomerase-like protein (cupin superfamily)